MAEERNLGVARAAESEDTDSTKAELQRRMEEARESITQTVTEIKDTVANQYQAVRDTVTEALDWREQYRKRPVAFSIGALSAGFILGYTVAGTFKGDGSAYEGEDDYPTYEESDVYSTTGAVPSKLSASSYGQERSELIRPAAAAAAGSTGATQSSAASGSYSYQKSASLQSAYDNTSLGSSAQEAEADKPGLIERFKETRAYDKLQEEVSVLGDRFIEELSSVGRNVVLPALFAKVKDLFGVDLSNQQRGLAGQGGTSSSSVRGQSGGGGGSSSSAAQAAGSSAYGSAGSGTGTAAAGSSYATSENRAYQTPSTEGT